MRNLYPLIRLSFYPLFLLPWTFVSVNSNSGTLALRKYLFIMMGRHPPSCLEGIKGVGHQSTRRDRTPKSTLSFIQSKNIFCPE